MPTLRRSIGMLVTSSPSKRTRPPASGASSPAMMQGRGLAAAGRAEEHQGLAARDLERHRFERAGVVGKGLGAGLQPNGNPGAHAALRLSRPSICMAISNGMIMMKKISV